MVDSPWRQRLRPASFRGAYFHVEIGSVSGGRRLAPHEFPKRDDPYTEDMGRKGRAFPVTGYLVGPEYQFERDVLIEALEAEGPGLLVHPTFGEFDVLCGPYSCTERRERGGFCEIEMAFLEAGQNTPFTIIDATQDQVRTGASKLDTVMTATGEAQIKDFPV